MWNYTLQPALGERTSPPAVTDGLSNRTPTPDPITQAATPPRNGPAAADRPNPTPYPNPNPRPLLPQVMRGVPSAPRRYVEAVVNTRPKQSHCAALAGVVGSLSLRASTADVGLQARAVRLVVVHVGGGGV